MRREERHHLKANPLAVLVSQTQDRLRVDGRTLGIVAVVVVAGLLTVGGYILWQQQQTDRAGDLLANAMAIRNAEVVPPPVESGEGDAVDGSWVQPPNSFPSEEARLEAALPELLAAADAYPRSPQGITARFQAATALVALGRFEEADAQYRQVIDLDAGQLYGPMARLGLAESQLLTGEYEEAISLLEGETGTTDSRVPVDAILMRLGRAYRLAGQDSDALAAYTRVLEEFPLSLYLSDARREAETLRERSPRRISSGG